MTNLPEKLTALFDELTDFEQKITELAAVMGLNLADYVIDHVALRANSEEKAKNWLTLWLKYGKILSDNVINGRPIYLLELERPLVICGQGVNIVELPYPKGKMYPSETWEHIELVMPFLVGETAEQWANRILNRFAWQKNGQLRVKLSEPKALGEQLANPVIAVSWRGNADNWVCIKVHPFHIKTILEV